MKTIFLSVLIPAITGMFVNNLSISYVYETILYNLSNTQRTNRIPEWTDETLYFRNIDTDMP